MQNNLLLIARHHWRSVLSSKALLPLLGLFYVLLLYATLTGRQNYHAQNQVRKSQQAQVRHDWEDSPDKHPHRMAHYGYLVFRIKHPLSIFDYGLESYTGNAIFLEAHRQNTTNFSEASFSSSLLRFGDISLAMLLQILLPLLVFFLGFNSISAERENGTLKMLFGQGVKWSELLFGKTLGLLAISNLFFLPVALVLLGIGIFETTQFSENLSRVAVLLGLYTIYTGILCLVAVGVSATSPSAKSALLRLLGLWLLWAIVLPRSTQALGNYLHPSPSKVAFDAAIEHDLIREGDSHNPDDPHYKAIKDSLLRVYQVDSVQQLPFNYSGFIMTEGERISADIYNRHLNRLLQIYDRQNRLAESSAWLNPIAALRNSSMRLAGTDFAAYRHFQQQAETFRYHLAQEMNRLQMRLISNKKLGPNDKPYQISRKYWSELHDFDYRFLSMKQLNPSLWPGYLVLLAWLLGLLLVFWALNKRLQIV
jgi:ABC-2 type transport system permease protein